MNAKRIRTIICVTAIAIMLFSSMGIGAFATVEQGAPQGEVKAQGEETSTDTEQLAVETPQTEDTPAVVEEEPAAKPDVRANGDTNGSTISVEVGKTEKLTADGLGEGVTWQSDNTDVATVDDQGNVTGVAVGKAIITATDSSEAQVSWEVSVIEPTPEYSFTRGVVSIRTVSGHQSIRVVWAPAKVTRTQGEDTEQIEANRYIVKRAQSGGKWYKYATINMNNGKPVIDTNSDAYRGAYKTSSLWTKEPASVGKIGSAIYFEDKDVGDGLMDNATKKFRGGDWTYRVIPVYVENGKVIKECEESKCTITTPDSCVRTSYVALKIKVNKKLYSHDKQHKKLVLKKGTTIYTCAFGYGRYQFIHGGNMYWLNRVATVENSMAIPPKTKNRIPV